MKNELEVCIKADIQTHAEIRVWLYENNMTYHEWAYFNNHIIYTICTKRGRTEFLLRFSDYISSINCAKEDTLHAILKSEIDKMILESFELKVPEK